ncbi:MAG: prolipoprotein diacylglyceryl transferase [Fibrobacteres bacterium]|nr:prolipoprotein diacylglyceryl transferase [Fibrobacterota bacterium]
MFPTLFKIGPFALHTYGLMLVAGFLIGVKLSENRAKKKEIFPAFIWDLFMVVVISAIVGARLFYVALNFDEFRGNLISIISPFQADGTLGIGGLVFIGGLIAAIISAIAYIKWRHHSILTVLDVCAPGVAIGMAVGRLGCFFAGCCYGLPTDSILGMSFPHSCPAGHYQLSTGAEALHPAQLYLVFGTAIVAALILISEKFKKFEGHSILIFVVLYAIDRSIVDTFRWYPEAEMHKGLTHNQIILGVACVFCTIAYIVLARRAKKGKTTVI